MSAFRTRVRDMLDLMHRDNAGFGGHLNTFLQHELTADHSSYSPADVRYLFMGDATHRGLFHYAGDVRALRRGTPKPHARAALMALFQLLANERSPYLTNQFRSMPVSDLRVLKLWNHLKHGDPEQQMAAFRLLRVLYHTLPPDQFRTVLNNKQSAVDLFNRFHAQWLRDNPSGVPTSATLGAATIAAPAGGKLPAALAAEIKAPVVEAAVQPVVQPVVETVHQTVVQPVVQSAEIVHTEREVVNKPIERAPVERPVVYNKPVTEVKGTVEATIQPVVKPVVDRVEETVIQPVVVQPEVVQVTKPAVENAPIHKTIDAGTRMAAPVAAAEMPGVKLPQAPIVEAVTERIIQPVHQTEVQRVIQPVIVEPAVVQVQREAIIEPATAGRTIVKEAVVAPPVVVRPEGAVAAGTTYQAAAPAAGTRTQEASNLHPVTEQLYGAGAPTPATGTLGKTAGTTAAVDETARKLEEAKLSRPGA